MTKELVREAGELAAGVRAELFLSHITSQGKFSEQASSLADVSDRDAAYSVDRAREEARQFAEDIGQETFEGFTVEFKAIGELGDKEEQILEPAYEKDCDHLFIRG